MCGIAGVALAETGRRPPIGLVQRLVRTLAARGPDDEQVFVGAGIGLGIRRLAITDPDGGRQPVASEDGSLRAVLNGQLYNHVQLREGLRERGHRFAGGADAEVLVHGYEEWGPEVLERLDGMFALALWDRRSRRLLLARDPAGQKPLYHAAVPGGLVFGSEPRALLAHPAVSRDLDREAVARYLLHDYVPAPRTIWSGMEKLEPGEALLWSRGALSRRRHGPAPDEERPIAPGPVPERDLAHQLLVLLERAVRKRLPREVPYATLLSGGLDSSLVTALATRATGRPVTTFTLTFPGSASYDESRPARDVARVLGTTHHEVPAPADPDLPGLLPEMVGALDEPLADPSLVPTTLLCRAARTQGPVVLSGDGGDELFAGYPTFQVEPAARLLGALPMTAQAAMAHAATRLPVTSGDLPLALKAQRFASGLGYPPARRHQVWLSSVPPHLLARILVTPVTDDRLFADVDRAWSATRGLPHLERLQRLYYRLYLGDGVLAKVDRAGMGQGLEVRSPFLDRAVVAFSRRLPGRLKLRGLTTKHLLKLAARALLPARIVRRPKKGFGPPIAAWLRGPLGPELDRCLQPERLRAQALFRPAPVQQLVDEHRSGRRDHRKALWALLAFQWWAERWT